jgi:hypothetical protein
MASNCDINNGDIIQAGSLHSSLKGVLHLQISSAINFHGFELVVVY